MKLVNYIIYFLKEVDTITIPGLGVFDVVYIPSEELKTGEIMPPSYQIIFSQQYDVNNDNIIKLISNIEKISLEDASENLKNTVSEWKKTISEQEILALNNLGDLYSDGERILFKMHENGPFKYKNFGLSSL